MNQLEKYKRKYLSFMRADEQAKVKVTNRGFEYKGNIIVFIQDLDKLVREPKKQLILKVTEPVVEEIKTERTVFTIDVGDLPAEKAKEVIKEVIEEHKVKKVIRGKK